MRIIAKIKHLFLILALLTGCGESPKPEEPIWKVDIAESEHGRIDSNVTEAAVGQRITFTIYVDENYLISSLFVNGIDYCPHIDEETMSFTTQMVEGGLHVKGDFSLDETPYPVIVSSSGKGKIESIESSAKIGETVSFVLTPDDHYTLTSFKVNDVEKITEITKFNSRFIYQTTMVKNGLIVEATFELFELFDIRIPENIEHAKISCDKEKAKIGEQICFYITPDYFYELKDLVVYYIYNEYSFDTKHVLNEVDKSSKPYVYIMEMVDAEIIIDPYLELDVVSDCYNSYSKNACYEGASFKVYFSFKDYPNADYTINSITLKIFHDNSIDDGYNYDFVLTPDNISTWMIDGYFSINIDSELGCLINADMRHANHMDDMDRYPNLWDETPFAIENYGRYWCIEINYTIKSGDTSATGDITVAKNKEAQTTTVW
jgi:hypothetical protein